MAETFVYAGISLSLSEAISDIIWERGLLLITFDPMHRRQLMKQPSAWGPETYSNNQHSISQNNKTISDHKYRNLDYVLELNVKFLENMFLEAVVCSSVVFDFLILTDVSHI